MSGDSLYEVLLTHRLRQTAPNISYDVTKHDTQHKILSIGYSIFSTGISGSASTDDNYVIIIFSAKVERLTMIRFL